MKLKRNIRWGAPAGIKQFHKTSFGTERSLPGEFSLFLLCTLLFYGSAISMTQSMFGWPKNSGSVLFRIFFLSCAVTALLEGVSLLQKRWRMWVRIGIGVTGTAGALFYLFGTKQGEEVLFGLQALVYDYICGWNVYFGTSYWVWQGKSGLLEEGLAFGLSVLCILTVWVGRRSNYTWIAAVVPLFVLGAGLLVGKVPTGSGLFLLAAAVLLCNGAGFRRVAFLATPDKYGRESGSLKHFLWVPVAVGVLLLCLVVRSAGNSSAEVRVEDGLEKMVEKQNEILRKVVDWDLWKKVRVGKALEHTVNGFLEERGVFDSGSESEYARLDNKKPFRGNGEVFRLTFEKKPVYGTYLAGFYADTYEDGIWDSEGAFDEFCKKNGFTPATVAEELRKQSTEWVLEAKEVDSLLAPEVKGVKGCLYYEEPRQTKAYLPYFSKSLDGGVQALEDSRYVKEKGRAELSFVLWEYRVSELVSYMFREGIAEDREKATWEEPYASYVAETFLTVPEGMEQVNAVAEEIRNTERSFFRIDGTASVNVERFNRAYQVADWMRHNTTYSLDLPELPLGAEPVEFFLGESRQGYCKHYAGASVLVLRKLGVPARYVSGYLVGDYEEEEENGNYTVTVRERNVHAWVEIYLEGIGWVPIEVTKGYSVLPAGEKVYHQTEDGGYRESYINWEGNGTGTGDSYGGTAPYNPSAPAITGTPGSPQEQGSQSGNGTGNQGQSHGTGDSENRGQENGPDYGKEKKTAGKRKLDLSLNPVIIVFAFPVLCMLFPFTKWIRKRMGKADERHMRRKMKRLDNRGQIELLNQRLYRKLRKKGRILKRVLRDTEYEDVLEKFRLVLSREERERYMHLVKAAAFSGGEFTEEEVEFCKQVYHKVLYEKGVKENDRE